MFWLSLHDKLTTTEHDCVRPSDPCSLLTQLSSFFHGFRRRVRNVTCVWSPFVRCSMFESVCLFCSLIFFCSGSALFFPRFCFLIFSSVRVLCMFFEVSKKGSQLPQSSVWRIQESLFKAWTFSMCTTVRSRLYRCEGFSIFFLNLFYLFRLPNPSPLQIKWKLYPSCDILFVDQTRNRSEDSTVVCKTEKWTLVSEQRLAFAFSTFPFSNNLVSFEPFKLQQFLKTYKYVFFFPFHFPALQRLRLTWMVFFFLRKCEFVWIDMCNSEKDSSFSSTRLVFLLRMKHFV